MTDALRDDDTAGGSSDRAASPEATGGIGTSYEHAAIATYLSALLIHGRAPACPGMVTGVAVQQQALGRPLDDIVLEWEDDAGRRGTLDLQLKRSLSISSGEDKDFAKIVAAAWATMNLPNFVDGRDLAGGLSEVLSAGNYYACSKLGDQARLETDAGAFAGAVANLMGQAARRAEQAVKTILTRALRSAPSPGDIHFFWRNFVVGALRPPAIAAPIVCARSINFARSHRLAEPTRRRFSPFSKRSPSSSMSEPCASIELRR